MINGLLFLASSFLCGIILPPPSSDNAPKAAAPTTPPATSSGPSTAAANSPSAAIAYNFKLAKIEHEGEKIECDVVMDDIYPEDVLIEKTRQLRSQYKVKTGFACAFYYKRYADNARCMAVFSYSKDCSACEGKDKNGEPLYAGYTMTKERADSLRAMKFDTAGYNQEATYLCATPNQKDILFSSGNAEALLVFLRTDGYSTYRLVKRLVDGPTLFMTTLSGLHAGRYEDMTRSGVILIFTCLTIILPIYWPAHRSACPQL